MHINKYPFYLGLLATLSACAALDDDREKAATPAATTPPERLFLQQVSSHSAIVKWHGGDVTEVCFGAAVKDLTRKSRRRCAAGVETAGGHREAQLTGLMPDRTYYYSLGDLISPDQVFRTPPDANQPPADGNTHILIVGDSGTVTEEGHEGEAAAVLAGFESYNTNSGGEAVDLFLALGDNAYLAGTDEQWQKAFFELYPALLKSSPVLPTIGNHEMGNGQVPLCLVAPKQAACTGPGGPDMSIMMPYGGVSISSDPGSYDGDGDMKPDPGGLPYLTIFSLPTAGESGGVASGTEQYYSVDYGNLHIVSLDSQLSARDEMSRKAMRDWLIDDLSNNSRDWTIVIFHHPPYTKGNNHDSDGAKTFMFGIDSPEFYLRDEFTGVFDRYGVDLVYSGHAHSYERSYYLRGLTGTSDTFDTRCGDPRQDACNAELNRSGAPATGQGGDAFPQLSATSGGVDDRVVYTVAGSSGKADAATDHLLTVSLEDWLRHPAHIPQPHSCDEAGNCRNGLALKGSVVVDATAERLTAKFIDVNGDVLDQFTITR